MPRTKIWNDNVHPYSETFKGEAVTIPAKGFIEMEYEEAIELKGTFGRGLAPIIPETGNPDERYYKMLRVDPPAEPLFKEDSHLINPVTGKKAATREELEAALRALAASEPDRVVKDPDADRSSPQVADLQRQVAELRDMIASQNAPAKGKPGPKPKIARG